MITPGFDHLPATIVNARRHWHVGICVVNTVTGTAAVGTVGPHVHVVWKSVWSSVRASLSAALVQRQRKIVVPSVTILILFHDCCFGSDCTVEEKSS